MDFTLFSNIYTVLSMVVFLGILFWAYSGNNKEKFDRIGRLPIDNDSAISGD